MATTSRPSDPSRPTTAEHRRLAEVNDRVPWRLWGPYQSGRQWGTVREDYSPNGDAWNHFPFDHAHARAYRWGEDGIAGLCDSHGFFHLSLALWNRRDDRLKERLFGLTNGQGNHGEDVKEYWWPLDATPSHAFAQTLYRYPQAAYPYQQLVEVNAQRSRTEPEYELTDTGVLNDNRFFDVTVTHAKAAAGDVLLEITAHNHGPDAAPLEILPQAWFRNTWSWGRDPRRPSIERLPDVEGHVVVQTQHDFLGRYELHAEGTPEVLFCENETNTAALFGDHTPTCAHPKDAINQAVVHGDPSLLSPEPRGTKVAFRYVFDEVPAGQSVTVRLRMVAREVPTPAEGAQPGPPRTYAVPVVPASAPSFGSAFDAVLEKRRHEADEFYAEVIPGSVPDEDRLIARRAFAGLLWGMQVYRYDVATWLEGDPAHPAPPPERRSPRGRNVGWKHLNMADVISMPDDWEYPWFAAWDLAFHCVALAHVDPEAAKNQLLLMCREWVQHPDGQLPAYEWCFSDVNPPVHAWAAWQVYVIDGCRDRVFLGRILTKLLLNSAWWMHSKDTDGSNLFEGGFLGLDNISVFDRSNDVPHGWRLEQSDATSWVAFAYLTMLTIALELSRNDPTWEDIATTSLERFLAIAEALEAFGSGSVRLWDDDDAFFYDVLVDEAGVGAPVKVRSLVGLVPLLAVALTPTWISDELPDFAQRQGWLEEHRSDLLHRRLVVHHDDGSAGTLAIVSPERFAALLSRIADEGEFLSPYGIRSLSAYYRDGVDIDVLGTTMRIQYVPGESDSNLFGGNSNWRGPVWFPMNVLLIDAIRTFAQGVGREQRIEFPAGSGQEMCLNDVAHELTQRLVALFRVDPATGRRPSQPADHPAGELWDAHPTFSEYFHGDTGLGLGASHQTGWTAMVAHLICTDVPDAAVTTAAEAQEEMALADEHPQPRSDHDVVTAR